MKIQIRKILCPIDFSENSDHALTYAQAFAQTHDAELLLLHVIETPVYLMAPDMVLPPETLDHHREVCEKQLADLAAATAKVHPRVSSRLVSGIPFLQIVQIARNEGVDLIVLGTHGRGALAHALMGSVAEKVVRKSPCPVLTVKHPEHEFVMP